MSREIVLVTGMSGGGLSTALKAFEDVGYEVVDNLPMALVEPLISSDTAEGRSIAVGVDSRTRDFNANELIKLFRHFKTKYRTETTNIHLIFIDCDTDILQKRFTETRRRHPLAKDRPILDGIEHERLLMGALLNEASIVIDTTDLNVHELRRLIREKFAPEAGQANIRIIVESFGFRYGLPRAADIVMDVRFLKNPHYVDDLRPKTGQDAEVAAYVASDPAYEDFFTRLLSLLSLVIPRYAEEGKSYLTLAIGCTGGKHRSVYTVERLAKEVEAMNLGTIIIKHRDIHRLA